MAKPVLQDPLYPANQTGIQADQAGAARRAVIEHEQKADPHPQYSGFLQAFMFSPRQQPVNPLQIAPNNSDYILASQVFGP